MTSKKSILLAAAAALTSSAYGAEVIKINKLSNTVVIELDESEVGQVSEQASIKLIGEDEAQTVGTIKAVKRNRAIIKLDKKHSLKKNAQYQIEVSAALDEFGFEIDSNSSAAPTAQNQYDKGPLIESELKANSGLNVEDQPAFASLHSKSEVDANYLNYSGNGSTYSEAEISGSFDVMPLVTGKLDFTKTTNFFSEGSSYTDLALGAGYKLKENVSLGLTLGQKSFSVPGFSGSGSSLSATVIGLSSAAKLHNTEVYGQFRIINTQDKFLADSFFGSNNLTFGFTHNLSPTTAVFGGYESVIKPAIFRDWIGSHGINGGYMMRIDPTLVAKGKLGLVNSILIFSGDVDYSVSEDLILQGGLTILTANGNSDMVAGGTFLNLGMVYKI